VKGAESRLEYEKAQGQETTERLKCPSKFYSKCDERNDVWERVLE
jgi:hypothetical protein